MEINRNQWNRKKATVESNESKASIFFKDSKKNGLKKKNSKVRREEGRKWEREGTSKIIRNKKDDIIKNKVWIWKSQVKL